MKLEKGYEYWDAECVPTRVHEKSKVVEDYHDKGWHRSENQTHPKFRGMSSSSDYSPITDDEDLAKVIRIYEKSRAQ